MDEFVALRARDVRGWVVRDYESSIVAWIAKGEVGADVKKGSGRKISVVELSGCPRVVVKTFYEDPGLVGRIVRRARFRGRREFRHLARAAELGIPVPRPLALVEARGTSSVWMQEVAGRKTVGAFFLEEKNFSRRVSALRALGAFLKSIHDRGFSHDDFHVGNVLVDPSGSSFVVLDLAGARFKGRALSRKERAESLVQVLASLQNSVTKTEYGRLLRAYGEDARTIWSMIAPLWVRLRARHVRSRAGRVEESGRSFTRRRIRAWDVLHSNDLSATDVEALLDRPDSASSRRFAEPDQARRWWINAWKLHYNHVAAPLGRVWARKPGADIIFFAEDDGRPISETTAIEDLGRFVRAIHDLGVRIPGLRTDDLTYSPSQKGFRLADPSRAMCVVDVPEKERARELESLFASAGSAISPADRRRFERAYAGWSRFSLTPPSGRGKLRKWR